MSRVRVKICGVTRPADARLAVELGADFIGVNFFPASPRCVAPERAREIGDAIAKRARLVGVFVNEAADRIREIESLAGLDLVQFHGDERVDEVAPFADRAIRALRLEGPPDADLLAPWRGVWGFLVEARHPSLYGGSGEPWAYEMIGSLPRERPLFVAGGVGPANVGQVLAATASWGVDVCSGVEAAPGVKDEALLRRLFDEVRRGEA
jgi:phosphoribosylanthranilate isomerase